MSKFSAEQARKVANTEEVIALKSSKKLDKIHKSIKKASEMGRYSTEISFWFGDVARYCVHELEREGYDVQPIRVGDYYLVRWDNQNDYTDLFSELNKKEV